MAIEDPITGKFCPTCGETLPLDSFYKRGKGSDALQSECKDCKKRRAKEHYEAQMATPDGRTHVRTMALKRMKRYTEKHPEKVRETQRKSNRRPERRAAGREYHRACRMKDPANVRFQNRKNGAKWRANNRELAGERSEACRQKKLPEYRAKQKDWVRDNPEKVQEKDQRRRASKRRAVPTWANDFIIEEIYRCCAERNELRTGGVEWSVDHIVPLQSPRVCGLHVYENLQVIPTKLNQSKGNRFWPDMP